MMNLICAKVIYKNNMSLSIAKNKASNKLLFNIKCFFSARYTVNITAKYVINFNNNFKVKFNYIKIKNKIIRD